MLSKIKENQELSKFIVEKCCENEVCVTIDKSISNNDYIIIKVDDFYNSLNLGNNTPPSPDCLIFRKCVDSGFGLTIVELKNITTNKHFDLENLVQKFETCLNDFIKIKFKEYFDIEYVDVKLFFVSHIEIYKRDLGLKMETLINKTFKFNGRKYLINPKMPHPTITPCKKY